MGQSFTMLLQKRLITYKKDGILLVDSGGQYHDGTTDITRTLTLDAPSENTKTLHPDFKRNDFSLKNQIP